MCHPKRYKSQIREPGIRTAKGEAALRRYPSLEPKSSPPSKKTMRPSLLSVIFAVSLIFKCYVLSGALPMMTKDDDSALDQETFASLLSDKATENGLADGDLGADLKARGSKIIVVASPNLLRDLRVLNGGMSLYKRRADNQVSTASDTNQDMDIPILRRDNMRCMVGRVYRPCWEV